MSSGFARFGVSGSYLQAQESFATTQRKQFVAEFLRSDFSSEPPCMTNAPRRCPRQLSTMSAPKLPRDMTISPPQVIAGPRAGHRLRRCGAVGVIPDKPRLLVVDDGGPVEGDGYRFTRVIPGARIDGRP